MNRRNLLTSVIAAGAGMLAIDGEEVFAQSAKMKRPTARNLPSAFIETPDHAALFYRDWGLGKTIVFVHSWAVSSELWQYQMIYLADQGMRCVAYDKRGHGRSSDPGHGYDADTLADDLAAVIDQLNLRDITLVGHSMGCGEIVRYLSRHGSSRVARIVLVSPTTPFTLKTADNPEGIDKAAFDRLRASWSKDFPKWLGQNARPFFTPETSPEMVQWGINMASQTSLKALIDCNRVDTETDFRNELPRVTVPTLIVHGDKDVSAPIDFTAKRTARLVPGSRLIIYEGAPHGLMLTHLERFNSDLLSFIRG